MSKDVETKPEAKAEVLESEKILADIEALSKGKTPPSADASKLATEAKPAESEKTTSEKAPKPTMEQEPAPKGKAEETKAHDDKKSGKPEVDIREWAKRKAINPDDTESVLKAYREMERKLSQINANKVQDNNVPQGNVPRGTTENQPYQPIPNWQPPQSGFTPQPAWNGWQPTYPTVQPQYLDRRSIIEQEAARFNMTPDDLERLLPLVNEVTELKLNRERQMLQAKYDAQLADLNRGNKRNAEFNELMADPLFTTPEVAFEIDQIMAENPRRLQLEPTPWTNMFKDALERIARKNLQGKNNQEEVVQHPTNPPKEGGRGNSPVVPVSNSPGTILEKFKDLDAAEMEKQLASIGAIPPR